MSAFEDTFTAAADELLTAHTPDVGGSWVLVSGDNTALVVYSAGGKLGNTSSTLTFVRSDDLGDADCYVEAELTDNGSFQPNTGIYCALRVQDADNFIGWYLGGTGGGGLRLIRMAGGSITNLLTMQGVVGNTYKIEAEGTTLRFYENGIQQGSDITESSFQTETKQGIVSDGASGFLRFISTYSADVLGGGSGISLTPSTINSSSVALNPAIQYSSLLQLSPTTINSSSISLDPVIEFSSVLTITPNTINSSSTSLNPVILFSGSLNISPVTIDSLSIALNPAIQFSSSINLSPSAINSASVVLNPVIGYTSALVIAPQVINSSSITINPLIEFKSLIDLIPLTINSLSITLRPNLNYGKVQSIGTVTAGFADDKYSVKYKLSGITVNFKE
mgnify:CR=1 FL=1|tara:strand:- start:541 stop:1716 length:1176 start_codon:yes stop_codon:yes gene_type:complete